MAKRKRDQPLVRSVLDRLLDDEPENSKDPPQSSAQVLRDLKNSVRRDLENLLNTRWRCEVWPPDLDQLDVSVVNYGIPDFSGINMSQTSERDKLRRVVEQVIKRFEPRFKSVKVQLVENSDELDRTLRLRIDALMFAEPAPEPVVFDSQLEPISGSFEISGGGR